MSQLSRPYQIALGALLVFALAWFAVLKPSDAAEAVPPAPAAQALPGAAGLQNAVDAAAAAKANAAARVATGDESAAGAAPAGQAAPAASGTPAGKTDARAADTDDPSAPILRDVERGKVAVLLFYSRRAADDRAVRRALARTDRRKGRVSVRAASISRVAQYAAITEGVDILQAPTILVIGKDGRTRSLVGFTDTKSIDQLVSDVGGPSFAAERG